MISSDPECKEANREIERLAKEMKTLSLTQENALLGNARAQAVEKNREDGAKVEALKQNAATLVEKEVFLEEELESAIQPGQTGMWEWRSWLETWAKDKQVNERRAEEIEKLKKEVRTQSEASGTTS